jgi:cell division septation protein DedD
VKKEEKKEKPLFSHALKGFKVQVASLETREHAVQEWQRLKTKPAFRSISGEIIRVDLGRERGIRHRVYVGPFSSKQAAQRFVEKLRALHMDTLVVAP